jgi:2,5-furandicarboxylate decarboxylase 2
MANGGLPRLETHFVISPGAGATVLPPVPAFYHRPSSIDDLLHTSGKVLDQFGIQHDLYRRWQG